MYFLYLLVFTLNAPLYAMEKDYAERSAETDELEKNQFLKKKNVPPAPRHKSNVLSHDLRKEEILPERKKGTSFAEDLKTLWLGIGGKEKKLEGIQELYIEFMQKKKDKANAIRNINSPSDRREEIKKLSEDFYKSLLEKYSGFGHNTLGKLLGTDAVKGGETEEMLKDKKEDFLSGFEKILENHVFD